MKYCEKCGQELSGSICDFCGQIATKTPNLEPTKTSSRKKSDQQARFRWLRSDRPKRYLAEMLLLSLVALIGVFVIFPGLQGQPQQEAEMEVQEPQSSNPQEETDQIPRELEQPQESLDEVPDTPQPNEQNQIPLEDEAFEALDESIYQWIETWNFTQDEPYVEDGPNCIREACVYDNLRVTFEPIGNYGLGDLQGSIELRTEQDTRIEDPSFEIREGEGQTELYRKFLVQGVDDLKNYDGDYYFNFIFGDIYELISFESEGREYNLQVNEADCYRTSEIWWVECGLYSVLIDFEMPVEAENGPHGYPVGYYDIATISSCSEIEMIGFNINGWAATFQAARDAGATEAFVSTQHYAKLFELDTNLDGVVCSSQAPD